MYYINKIAGWVLSPLGVLFLGFAVGTCLMRLSALRRLRSFGGWVIGIALAFIWVMGCGITTRIVGVGLESDFTVEGKMHGDVSDLPEADAIVVLGGGMGVHDKCGSAEMHGSADRVWQGAKLYKKGKAKLVSVSGPQVEKSTVPLMEDLGVPKSAMLYFSDARNTEEESKMIYARLRENVQDRPPKILLVTSAWHMNRSVLLFKRAGFDVVPAPTDFEMSYILEMPVRFTDFLPSADSLMRNSYAVKEWVGNIGYRLLRR